mgnify:CR=1 FL=1
MYIDFIWIFRWYSSNYAKAIGMPETPDGSPLGMIILSLFVFIFIFKNKTKKKKKKNNNMNIRFHF